MSFFIGKIAGNNSTTEINIKKDRFITTEGQTVFILSDTYKQHQNKITVTISGVTQSSPNNFTETTASSFTLQEGLPAGKEVVATYFQ